MIASSHVRYKHIDESCNNEPATNGQSAKAKRQLAW